jgi:hypothetical protein
MQDAMHRAPCVKDEIGHALAARKFADQVRRRREFFEFSDANVIGIVRGHAAVLLFDSVRFSPAIDLAEAKKNRQVRWRFFGNSGLLNYALTPLSIRQRTEMPKEVKIKLRGHDGDEAR